MTLPLYRLSVSNLNAVSIVAVMTAIVSTTLVFFLYFNVIKAPVPNSIPERRNLVASCIADVTKAVAPPKMSPALYERFWRLCGNQEFNELYLDDFLIRRQKFISQEFDERVNLWLVVAITVSGVFLAALQLIMSYKLSMRFGNELSTDGNMTIEAGRISLRSSVTGLMILALSLAFFMIYVVYIYSVKEVQVGRPSDLQAPVEMDVDPSPKQAPSQSDAPPSDRDAPEHK